MTGACLAAFWVSGRTCAAWIAVLWTRGVALITSTPGGVPERWIRGSARQPTVGRGGSTGTPASSRWGYAVHHVGPPDLVLVRTAGLGCLGDTRGRIPAGIDD